MLMQIQNNPALKDGLEQLLNMTKIRAVDLAFADFVYSEESALDASDTSARECLTMLSAFVSAQSGEQHSCIDLEKLGQPFLGVYRFPELNTMLSYIQNAGTFVCLSTTGVNLDEPTAKPIILQDGKLYLQRYWQYESQLAAIIREKATKVLDLDITAAKVLLSDLFDEEHNHAEQGQTLDWQKIAVCIAASQTLSFITGGPGTGKTTTIAKLAAQAAHKFGVDQVAIITLDNYRIGAYEQIATYGKIIGCSVKQAHNSDELSDLLYQFRNKRLVLVDTAGFSQKDTRLIKQLDTMKQNSCANIRHYLVMQANCQYRVMQQTVSEYRQISLQGCILTKLDECYSLGEVISVAIENKLQICYLADGQRVPEDLQSASTKFLITSAAKLYKKYGLIHNRPNYIDNTAVAV